MHFKIKINHTVTIVKLRLPCSHSASFADQLGHIHICHDHLIAETFRFCQNAAVFADQIVRAKHKVC